MTSHVFKKCFCEWRITLVFFAYAKYKQSLKLSPWLVRIHFRKKTFWNEPMSQNFDERTKEALMRIERQLYDYTPCTTPYDSPSRSPHQTTRSDMLSCPQIYSPLLRRREETDRSKISYYYNLERDRYGK